MRLKSIIASAFTALMVACPVLAFSESADFDDSVPDTDETMTIDTPASNADSNDVAWLSASKDGYAGHGAFYQDQPREHRAQHPAPCH